MVVVVVIITVVVVVILLLLVAAAGPTCRHYGVSVTRRVVSIDNREGIKDR